MPRRSRSGPNGPKNRNGEVAVAAKSGEHDVGREGTRKSGQVVVVVVW